MVSLLVLGPKFIKSKSKFLETLRKYPPITFLNRQCVKDYKLPDMEVQISKGTAVVISVLGLHHDPEYFPDPDVFDPERFSEGKKSLIKSFSYLPFGDGPRACIGKMNFVVFHVYM